jgi:serine/threonine protein kinase
MSDSITGSVIAGRYRVTGFLRPGRMGDLYVARRSEDDRKVAVKLLDPSLFSNPEAVGRFEREAKVSQAIDHPCTLRVLEYGRAEIGPFLVLEYVEGELLSDLVEEGALEPERAAVITARIALALGAAHEKGVIHRDLSPTNVVVGSGAHASDIVKVSDFGLAVLTEKNEEESTLTAVGVRIGTPTYMAPEYIEEYELDHRADIYGLGVMLFEMLTGGPPFTGRPYKVMEAHVHEPMPKPSTRQAGVPPWLDEVVNRMTAKRPDQRFQSAAEVVSAIEAGLGRPVDVVDYQAITPLAPPSRSSAQEGPTKPRAAQKDPILEHFLTTHAGTVTRGKTKAPPLDRRFVVTRVAPESVAGRHGVEPGWTCILPDEESSGLLDPRTWTRVAARRRWVFFPTGSQESLEVETSGLPIGVELCRSPENVLAHYDPLLPEASALLDLWRHQRWEDLGRLAQRTLVQQKPTPGIGGALLSRFMGGGEKRTFFDHPALLFAGIAALEQKRPQGLLDVTDFGAKYASKWPNVYGALAQWYTAMAEIKRSSAELKPDDPVVQKLTDVVLREPLPLLVARYVEMTGKLPPAPQWLGKVFSEYSMDAVDGKLQAKLSETLDRMDQSQLLAVCLLGGVRGNLDYDEFMHRFAHQMAFFEPFLYGLHVVTTQHEPELDRPDQYRGEAVVRTSRIPFVVLHDYRAFVQRSIKPLAIPTIYLLDQRGTCVHEGKLGECELWEALGYAGQLRAERFRGPR